MLKNNLKKFFIKNGYIVLKPHKKKHLYSLKKSLHILINNSFKKNNIKILHNSNDVEETINKGMINLEKKNHKYLSEIYDIMSKSTHFISFITDRKLLNIVKSLLNLSLDKNILINSTTIRMDPPGVSKFTYGWHKDENTNIPGSNFVQLWSPIFSNVDKNTGALEIAVGSHLYKNKTNIETYEKKKLGKINRSNFYKVKIINDNYKKIHLKMRMGEVLLFNKKLLHRSGIMKKNKMRYACTAFYHNINEENFRYLKIDQK